MKKFLFITLSFLFSIQLAFAQLAVSQEEFYETAIVGQDVEITMYLSNTSEQDISIQWSREVDAPEAWLTWVCDPVQCYTPFVNDSPSPISVSAGQQATFKVSFRILETDGPGSLTLNISDVNDTSVVARATFNVNAEWPVGNEDIAVENIKVYPNPTANHLQLSQASGLGGMEIYNVIGRKVRVFGDLRESERYNVADLPNGIYMVRLLDEDGNLVVTKRIRKI